MIDITDIEKHIVKEILERIAPDVKTVAFGSRVKGNKKSYSDLDLALISDTRIPDSLMSELSECFAESDLPYRVDLIDLHTVSGEFRELIENQCEPLF